MKTVIISVLFVLALSFAAFGQSKAIVLKVEVEGGKSFEFGAKELGGVARREVSAKGHDEKMSTYSGWNLGDLLRAAGAKLGKDELKGKDLGAYVVIEAADGYRATFSVAELSADFTDKAVIVADLRDGKPFDDKTGPFQVIVPDDKKHGRWVRQVTAIRLKKVH